MIRRTDTNYSDQFAHHVMMDGLEGQGGFLDDYLFDTVVDGSPPSMSSPETSEPDADDEDDEDEVDPVSGPRSGPISGPVSGTRRLRTRTFDRTDTLDPSRYTEVEMACLEACRKQKEELLSHLVEKGLVVDPDPPTEGGQAPMTKLSQRVGESSKLWNGLRKRLYDHFRYIGANLPDAERYTLTTETSELELTCLEGHYKPCMIEFTLNADFETEEEGKETLCLPSYFVGTSQGGDEPDWRWTCDRQKPQPE